jgi:hypothetical protein
MSKTSLVLAALDYLTAHGEPAPPRTAIVLDPSLPHDGSCSSSGHIFINPTSDQYRSAERGDLAPLVVLLAHEQYHVAHGPDEIRAFSASIDFIDQHFPTRTDLRADAVERWHDALKADVAARYNTSPPEQHTMSKETPDNAAPPDPYRAEIDKIRERRLDLAPTPDLDPAHKANPAVPPDPYKIHLAIAEARRQLEEER